jgi:hypothetical protein
MDVAPSGCARRPPFLCYGSAPIWSLICLISASPRCWLARSTIAHACPPVNGPARKPAGYRLRSPRSPYPDFDAVFAWRFWSWLSDRPRSSDSVKRPFESRRVSRLSPLGATNSRFPLPRLEDISSSCELKVLHSAERIVPNSPSNFEKRDFRSHPKPSAGESGRQKSFDAKDRGRRPQRDVGSVR